MNSNTSTISKVSDTAFWVAAYRAIETKKNDALFSDPFANVLAGELGEKVSSSMKSITPYAYWSVTVRTRLIDDCILKYIAQGYKTIINLGAGLDARPYRLELPQDVRWIEVDFPDVIEFKKEKLADKTPHCNLERIGLNLSDHAMREKQFAELNARIGQALVLTEGVIPYLDESSVSSLAADIRNQTNFNLWLTEYYSPEMYRWYQSPKFKRLMGDSAFKFFPANWFDFFKEHGWEQKEIQYLYDVAKQHNRSFPVPWWVSVLKLIFGEERIMKQVKKSLAYTVFEKTG